AATCGLVYTNAQLRSYFINALNDKLRCVAKTTYPHIHDPIELAEHLDMFITEQDDQLQYFPPNPGRQPLKVPTPAQPSAPNPKQPPPKKKLLTDDDFEKLKGKGICFHYYRGYCYNGDTCPYKHILQSDVDKSSDDKPKKVSQRCVKDLTSKRLRLLCPTFPDWEIILDTGCTDTLISKEFASILLKTLDNVIITKSFASFQTIREEDELISNHRLSALLPIIDVDGCEYHLSINPFIIPPISEADMLIGMDLLDMIGSGLNLIGFIDESQHPITSFFNYEDEANNTIHLNHKSLHIDVSGKLDGPIDYPPVPPQHVIVDTVLTSPWLAITVRKNADDSTDSPKWFHIDLSNQATSLAFEQQFKRVPDHHWRMKMTSEEGK
ncbi:hypothetical protein FOL47_000165, partial [Perkinsus chesapeaki]